MAYINSSNDGSPLKSHQKNQEHENIFDRHTLRDVEKVISQKKAETKEQASEMLQKLDLVQVLGITDFGLTLDQVSNPKLEDHSLAGIMGLTAKENGLTNPEAFQRLKGLDENQTIAVVDLGFKRPQVLDPEFGEHTLIGVVALIKNQKAKTIQQALGVIQGLNHNETTAVVFQGLTKSKSKNIKAHTVVAIDTLQELGLTSAEAFNKIKGLDAPKTTKIIAKVSSSFTSQISTGLDAKKHSTNKTIASLISLSQPQEPDAAKGESLRKNDKETAKNKHEKKSRKPRRKQ